MIPFQHFVSKYGSVRPNTPLEKMKGKYRLATLQFGSTEGSAGAPSLPPLPEISFSSKNKTDEKIRDTIIVRTLGNTRQLQIDLTENMTWTEAYTRISVWLGVMYEAYALLGVPNDDYMTTRVFDPKLIRFPSAELQIPSMPLEVTMTIIDKMNVHDLEALISASRSSIEWGNDVIREDQKNKVYYLYKIAKPAFAIGTFDQTLHIFGDCDDLKWVKYTDFLRLNQTIKNLDIHNCIMNDVTLKNLAEAVAHNTTLKFFNLTNVTFTTPKKGEYISKIIAANTSITLFCVSQSNLDDADAEKIAHQLERNTTITFAIFDGNNFAPVANDGIVVCRFADVLQNNQTIKQLWLENCHLGELGMRAFIPVIQSLTPSRDLFLDLARNGPTETTVQDLQNAWQARNLLPNCLRLQPQDAE